MTATTPDIEGALSEQPVQTPDAPQALEPTTQAADPSAAQATPAEGGQALLMNAPANRCRVCAAEMASEQRYCVECGTRRGKPRFVLDKGTAATAGGASTSPPSIVAAGWTRMTALLAVAVVLLAIAIGILIGNSGDSISQPVKVQITGGALSTGASGSSGSSKAASGAKKTTKPAAPAFSVGS